MQCLILLKVGDLYSSKLLIPFNYNQIFSLSFAPADFIFWHSLLSTLPYFVSHLHCHLVTGLQGVFDGLNCIECGDAHVGALGVNYITHAIK